MKFPSKRRGATAWRYDSDGTYFHKWGFSINEGEFPNICLKWSWKYCGFYIALSPRLKWYWFR